MIRDLLSSLPRACAPLALALALTAGLSSPGAAQGQSQNRPAAKQAPAAQKPQAQAPAEPGKPVLVANVGDWGVYVTSGGAKQCYALAQPKDRAPAALKRDPAYLFISSRPAEKVRHEVSIIMGFDVKAADKVSPEAQIGSEKFALAAQGPHLWVKDANKTGAIIDSLRKGQKLTVKATSLRGNVTTDSYSLNGLGGALDRVQRECP